MTGLPPPRLRIPQARRPSRTGKGSISARASIGRIRPGQWLLAHELAHTVQQRPNVIARRALETGGGDPSAATVTDGGEAADPRVDETVDALKDVAGGGSAQGGQAAKDRLQDLDTPARLATLHRIQSLAPPAEKQKVAARIDDAVTGPATPDRQEPQGKASAGGARQQMGATGKEAASARKKGENQPGVELRSPAKAAPVPSVDRAASTEPASAPAPTHSAASAAAATQMQQAVQSISAETPVEADAALGASQDATAAGASARADRPAAATGAQAAANDAMATMAAQLWGSPMCAAFGLASKLTRQGRRPIRARLCTGRRATGWPPPSSRAQRKKSRASLRRQ